MVGLLMSAVESELIWKVYFRGFYQGKGTTTKKKTQDSELVRSQDREKDVPRKGWVRSFA